MATDVGTLVIGVTADVAGLTAGLEAAQKKLRTTGQNMIKAGAGITAGVTAPIVGIGAASIAAVTDLNSSMANVQSLLTEMSDGGQARTVELTNAVQSMAVETGKSTDDLAGGLYNVISAFGDTADTVDILRINAQAAAAGLATTEEAIALTSAVTKGYGDTSAEAVQSAADLAFTAVRLGQTTFPELAGAMGSVVPIAASLGAEQEELFAVMATATGVTGGAAEVSTQLRGVLQSLMAPTSDMAALIDDLGYASGEALLQGEGLQGTMAAIVAAAEASGTPLQKYMGSIEGQTLALALAGPLSESYTSNLESMGAAAGAADAAFVAQTEGVNAAGFAMDQTQQKLAVIAQDLGEALVPALAAALDAATPFIDKIVELAAGFTALTPQQQRMILGATALAAAVGPAVMVIGTMVTAVSAAAPVVGALVSAVGLLLNPVVLVAAAVGALAAILFDWGGANEKVAETLEGWGLEGVADFVRQLHENVEALTETVGALLSGETSFADFFEANIPTWIATLFDWVWPVLGPIGWIVKLIDWTWPTLSKPAWIGDLLDFDWPGFPSRPKWLGGGDDVGNNASGTGFWRGGPTWVGERGPEIISPPRGSQIIPADVSAALSGRPIEIHNHNTIRDPADIQRLALAVARELRRQGA